MITRPTPVIGITLCNQLPDYEESVRRAGGQPRVLSMDDPPSLDGLDGVLFTGGGDIDPAYYRDNRHPRTKDPDARRDAYELALAALALSADRPVLAVCRGLQVINVAAGGTLIQDIPSQVPTAVTHHVSTALDAFAHNVTVARGSTLAQALQQEIGENGSIEVNSRHHQAPGEIGDGFVVSATSPDNVVEAIERPQARFCVGVQWHPENFWRSGRFRSLFEAFVRAAGTTAAFK